MAELSTSMFAQLVAKYINHANVLNNTSVHYKKKVDFLTHLGHANNILTWIEAHNYDVGTRALCKQLCDNREHLFGILPSTMNNSYRNSLKRITTLISVAEKALQGEEIKITELN